MSLVRPRPPRQAFDALHAALAPLADDPDLWRASPLAGVNLQDIAAVAPHRCYRVGAKDVMAGRLLEGARPRAWQFLLVAKERLIGAAELVAKNRKLAFHALDCGPFALAFAGAHQRAERFARNHGGHFEIRVLEAVGLGLVALWLRRPRSDLFVPLAMPAAPAPPKQPVDRETLLKSWQPAAKRVLAFHEQFLQEKQDAGQRTPKKTKAAQSRG